MDVKKPLLVKSLRELLITTAYLSHNNKQKPQISKRKRPEWVKIYQTVTILLKNYGVHSDFWI